MRTQVSARPSFPMGNAQYGLAAHLRRRFVILKVRASRYAGIGAGSRMLRELHGLGIRMLTGLLSAANKGLFVLWQVLSLLGSLLVLGAEPLSRLLSKGKLMLRSPALAARRHLIQINNRALSRIAPAALLGCATVFIITVTYFGVSLDVTVNGVPMGAVEAKDEVEAAVAEVEGKISEYLGSPYHLSANIDYRLRLAGGDGTFNKNLFREMMMSSVQGASTQYVLTVDGEVVGANCSKTALEMLKRRLLQSRSAPGENVKTELLQEIKIEERPAADSQIKTIEEIETLLNSNTREVVTYTVQTGDTVSGIAQKHNMRVSEIQALNPGLNIDKIGIGDEFRISAAVPFLSVKQTKRLEYLESIPFDTVTQKTDALYNNQSRIIRKGVAGEAQVVADVIYIDSVEQERTLLSYSVITQPQAQIKEVGTKQPPAKTAKGNFILPFKGLRTSTYGYRKSMGDFHTGVDYAGPKGSTIVAADGGTVSFAGWKGTYGYCVIITHGDTGYETLYAHCSKLLVKQGQKVAQGESIAQVGSTGRSTGPHLHFEVRIDGKTVNPSKYIGKTYY